MNRRMNLAISYSLMAPAAALEAYGMFTLYHADRQAFIGVLVLLSIIFFIIGATVVHENL